MGLGVYQLPPDTQEEYPWGFKKENGKRAEKNSNTDSVISKRTKGSWLTSQKNWGWSWAPGRPLFIENSNLFLKSWLPEMAIFA